MSQLAKLWWGGNRESNEPWSKNAHVLDFVLTHAESGGKSMPGSPAKAVLASDLSLLERGETVNHIASWSSSLVAGNLDSVDSTVYGAKFPWRFQFC